MMILRTFLFFAGWMALTLLMGVLAIPTLVSQRAVWMAAHIWARLTLLWLRVACGITSQVQGLEHLRDARIVAANHQSAWDTLMLWCLLKHPVFVLKRELYWIPIFGWYLWRTGQIGINRAKPQGVIEQVVTSMQRYGAQGRVLVIFPQGTRVKPTDSKPFKHGIGRISAALQWPVVPASLNAGWFWPKRPLWKRPGAAVIAFAAAMPAPANTHVAPWVATLEQGIMQRVAQLPR